MNSLTQNTKILAFIAAVAMLLGSFLPWMSISAGFMTVDIPGISSQYDYHEGYLSLICGAVCLIGIFFGMRIIFLLASVGMFVGGIYDLQKIVRFNGDKYGLEASVSPGIGIILVLAASILGLITAIWAWKVKTISSYEPPVYGDAYHRV